MSGTDDLPVPHPSWLDGQLWLNAPKVVGIAQALADPTDTPGDDQDDHRWYDSHP